MTPVAPTRGRSVAFVVAFLALATSAAAQDAPDLAALDRAELERRVEATPNDAALRRALADRLTADDAATAAIPHLRWLAEADPEAVGVRDQLARHLLWAGRPDEAVPVLDELVALDADNVEARVTLAEIVMWDGGAARAVDLLAAPADRRPDDARLQRAYAFALLASGDEPAARRQLSRALALLPDDPDLLLESGSIERWQGDWSLGRRRLARALVLDLDAPQRARATDLLDGLRRQMAPTVTTVVQHVDDSNGVERIEAPLRVDVTLNSRWALGVEVVGDRIAALDTASAGAGRAVPSLAFSPSKNLRLEAAAGVELAPGGRALPVGRMSAQRTWAGRRFALVRLAAETASATDAVTALEGGLRATDLWAEGYAEPTRTLALSGTLGSRFYSDDNRRLVASTTARWLPLQLGRRDDAPPVFAVGPAAGALYEDTQTVYPTSVPYYTPDDLTTLSLGLASRLVPGHGISFEGTLGATRQATGPSDAATSLELGASAGYDQGRHAVRVEARRSGSSVYSSDLIRLTYRLRAW